MSKLRKALEEISQLKKKSLDLGESWYDRLKEATTIAKAALKEDGGVQLGEWQCCPVCNGNGQILADGFTSMVYQQCPTCAGNRIIQKPVIEPLPQPPTQRVIEGL